MSARWFVTAGAMTLTFLLLIAWNAIFFKILDPVTILTMGAVIIWLSLQAYNTEKTYKQMIIQMEKIRTMNEELKNLLMSLPDGIVLVDEKTSDLSLVNNEFKRLFSLPDNSS